MRGDSGGSVRHHRGPQSRCEIGETRVYRFVPDRISELTLTEERCRGTRGTEGCQGVTLRQQEVQRERAVIGLRGVRCLRGGADAGVEEGPVGTVRSLRLNLLILQRQFGGLKEEGTVLGVFPERGGVGVPLGTTQALTDEWFGGGMCPILVLGLIRGVRE